MTHIFDLQFKRKARFVLTFFLTLLFCLGCSTMNIKTIASDTPIFNFEEYFTGHVKASGWFTDRFGNIKRHFCGDFYGAKEGEDFVLDEALYYSSGAVEKRQWRVRISDDGVFSGESPALINGVSGQIVGNTLRMAYVMKVDIDEGKQWVLDMDDWMIYKPDGSLHNQTYVSKWGIKLGRVSTQYQPHDGELLCHQMIEKHAINARKVG